ncbi:MAG: ligase-associated DNA damage response exonuclease [Saprospiraceae bacterium]|nr:ligase-associated DNA damage response exonuclease [Saprospiraceae bacterium]
MALLEFTKKGIYCPQADVFIDPWKPVAKALITHAHSDHARSGHRQYVSTLDSIPILKQKLGSFIQIKGLTYNEKFSINGVQISFHPAGHIIGSAQIRLEYKGEIWVVSGDYKIEDDGLSGTFEPIKCHTFISESTFGIPSFNWRPQAEIYKEINDWWKANKENGVTSIISAYSLGKAQRIINNLDQSIGQIFVHGAIENTNKVFRNQGFDIKLSSIINNTDKSNKFKDAIIIVPPSVIGSAWTNRFLNYKEAVVSGWMADASIKLSRKIEYGFPLSDHADWAGLNDTIEATGAHKIFVTHGYSEIFSKWLVDKGYDAQSIKTTFTED